MIVFDPNTMEKSDDPLLGIVGAGHSRAHLLAEFIEKENCEIFPMTREEYRELSDDALGRLNRNNQTLVRAIPKLIRSGELVPIVVKHDWRAILADAIKSSGAASEEIEWKLPFDSCIFEMRVQRTSGRVSECFVIIFQCDGFVRLALFTAHLWNQMATFVFAYDADNISELVKAWNKRAIETTAECRDRLNVLEFCRAACIALDCEIAETETILAPPKLNKARAKRGKGPLPNHKVINLAKKFIGAARATTDERARRVRLHLRRGHWWPRLDNRESRFDRFRKWRPWRLVGDPDLGYIEHEYRI